MENGTHFAQAGRQAGRQADVCGLFRGDCFRHLKTLADGAIALITDPPFGVTDNAWDKALDLQRFWAAIEPKLSPRGIVVCDPFAGSGTTAIAVAMEGRRYFACEKDPRIFALAQRRLAEAIAQPLAA